MDRKKRKQSAKSIRYFFLNNKIHKVLSHSRSKDQMVAWCYPDKKRVMYSYSQVEKHKESAYTIKESGVLLNKHKITIENYILSGKIKVPQKVYPISNPDSSWFKFMLSESDILDLHQYMLDAGYTKNTPSRSELLALLKHNIILYTKTDSGFVPVWKAE